MLCRGNDPAQTGRKLLTAAGLVALYRMSLVVADAAPMRLYNGLDTRADGLLMGSALAAGLHYGKGSSAVAAKVRRQLHSALMLPLAGLALALLLAKWQQPLTYLLFLPLTAACSTALIGAVDVVDEATRVRRVLSSAVLVAIGRISYGLYLWHYPIYRLLGRNGFDPVSTAVVGTGLTVVLAMLSWHLVERPILGLKGRFSPSAARRMPSGERGVLGPQ